MATFEDQVQSFDIRGILITSILTGMSILVAWLWKDALADTVNMFLPAYTGAFSSYITATIGTIVVVIFAYLMLKSQKINRKHIITFRERMRISAQRSEKLKRIKEIAKNKKARFKYKYRPKKRTYFF